MSGEPVFSIPAILPVMNFRCCSGRFGLSGLILLATLLVWVAPGLAATNAAPKLASADCLDCHTDPSNKRMVNGHAEPMALFPDQRFCAVGPQPVGLH